MRFACCFLSTSLLLLGASVAAGHGLQVNLEGDPDGGLAATYAFGPHARVQGRQIGAAQLWDERVRYAPDYPTLGLGEEAIISWNGSDYLIHSAPAEWDGQSEWRLAPESVDFPGFTPRRSAYEAIAAHYDGLGLGGQIDFRVNLQGPLQEWDGSAFAPAVGASVSLITQDWPTPPDGFWYVELGAEATSGPGSDAAMPYDIGWSDYDSGEHWHYLWRLNGPSAGVPAADGVYAIEYTVSAGDGGLESDPLWLLLRQGVLADTPEYRTAEAAAIAAVIPEPAAALLALVGAAALGVRGASRGRVR